MRQKQIRRRNKSRRAKYKLSELLARCKGKNPYPELITGRVGKEIF